MKHWLCALVVVLAACTSQDGGSHATTDSAKVARTRQLMEDTSNYTTIAWMDSTTQDLGAVMSGAQVDVVWRFRNTGNRPLVIEKASPSCGCTVPEIPKEPIAPGQEGRIRATFDSKGREGTQHKSVLVTANTRPMQAHELVFNIEVKNP